MEDYSREQRLKWGMEGLWLLITAVVVVGVMFPIWQQTDDFRFNLNNIIHIVVFITFARYIFLLKHTWLANAKWVKVALMALSTLILMFLVRSINAFSVFAEEEGLQTLLDHLPHKRQWSMVKYIRTEYLFFAVGSAITAVLFPIRMLISVWRNFNRKGRV